MEKYSKLKQELMNLISPRINDNVFKCDNLVINVDRNAKGLYSIGALTFYDVSTGFALEILEEYDIAKSPGIKFSVINTDDNYSSDSVLASAINKCLRLEVCSVLEFCIDIIKKLLCTFTFDYDEENQWTIFNASFDKSSIDNIISYIMTNPVTVNFSSCGSFEIVINSEDVKTIYEIRDCISAIILNELR